LDQRGTGESIPDLSCTERLEISLDNGMTGDALLNLYRSQAQKCAEHFRREGIDLDAYNTIENSDDVNAIRLALGVDKIRLVAMSYGTHLALTTIRRYEEHIDRAVLAGVEAPHQTLKLPDDMQDQLKKISDLIAADPIARPILPDFEDLVTRIVRQLEIEPVSVTLPEDNLKITITAQMFRRIVAGMIPRRWTIEEIPMFFAPLQDDNFVPLAELFRGSRISLSAMSAAMDCASGVSLVR
jgi:pimeloyl-ACP methyl ester carboxylesterase